MLARFAKPVFWLLLIGGALAIFWQRGLPVAPIAAIDPTSEAAFEAWLAEDADSAADFRQLEAFLRKEGVLDVAPAWQLARLDRFYAARCDLDYFRIPPEELWPNIVEPLELVRDRVIPVVGKVSVQSSYRTPEMNVCARGASRSRHLQFAALDMRLASGTNNPEALYRTLCDIHAEAGSRSRMGLGAYYSIDGDGRPSGGRFHIDASGWRTWGRSYTSASSPCGRFS